jgi:hypothetical protein
MFMCQFTGQQFEDKDLAYTAILESRLSHPAASTFLLKFSSKHAVLGFLESIKNQRQNYVVTKVRGEKKFGPATPLDLIHLIGSDR